MKIIKCRYCKTEIKRGQREYRLISDYTSMVFNKVICHDCVTARGYEASVTLAKPALDVKPRQVSRDPRLSVPSSGAAFIQDLLEQNGKDL